jgi:hypothetical protein
LTTIPNAEEKPKKRRKPSKKERDYCKRMKLEEEKRERNERKYEKFLRYGAASSGVVGGRGSARGREGGRARGRGRPMR